VNQLDFQAFVEEREAGKGPPSSFPWGNTKRVSLLCLVFFYPILPIR
jgi:hypothetical protein